MWTACYCASVLKTVTWIISCIVFIHRGNCEKLADGTFSSTDFGPRDYGIWRTSAYCDFSFPGKDIDTPHSAYVYTRFGVSYVAGSYLDYMSGSIASEDSKRRWVVVSVGYQTTNSQLQYILDFEYDDYIGNIQVPGDCQLFTTQQEAIDASQQTADLVIPLADPLLASSPFTVKYTNPSGGKVVARMQCDFTFSGQQHGAYEAYILLNFTEPVSNYNDFIGVDVRSTATDNTWYIVRSTYAMQDSSSMEIDATADSDQVVARIEINGYAYLYVEEAAAVSATVGITTTTAAPTTTVPIPTTTTVPIPTTTVPIPTTTVPIPTTSQPSTSSTQSSVASSTTGLWYTGTVVTVATMAATSTTPVTVAPTTVTATSSKIRVLEELSDLRNMAMNGTELWTLYTSNLLRCSRRCIGDIRCYFVLYLSLVPQCSGLMDLDISGAAYNGSSIYMVS